MARDRDVEKMLAELRPYDVGVSKLRVGSEGDGGYVMLDRGLRDREGGVAYSYGIGNNVEWDQQMASFGYEVYQYDHTVRAPPIGHDRFRFKAQGIGADFEVGVELGTLAQHLRENGHEGRDDLILKMDVEGAEWRVLGRIEQDTLGAFQQIVVEMHALCFPPFGLKAAVLGRLMERFVVHHVHANNCAPLGTVGTRKIPEVLELSLLRRDLVRGARRAQTRFPTELDRPNTRGRDDIPLDFYPFLPPPRRARAKPPVRG